MLSASLNKTFLSLSLSLSIEVNTPESADPTAQIQKQRAAEPQRAAHGQLAQTGRLVKRTQHKTVAGNPWDNEPIPIPLINRSDGGDPGLDEHDLYWVAIRACGLKGRYGRTQFDLCAQRIYGINCKSAHKEIGLWKCTSFKARLTCYSRFHSCLTLTLTLT